MVSPDDTSDPRPQARFTRRDFLRGVGAAIAGTAAFDSGLPLEPAHSEAAENAAATGAARVNIVLDVNGQLRAVEVEPQASLADILRGPLNLPGTKIGCGRGACSACTVWLDRTPILSCMVLAIDVGERKVVTIEGLARGPELHPVQSAFIAHDAIQCGFCTPGLVMSCAALVESNRNPSDEDVKTAISGHLCRCGTYPHVVEAVLDAAKSLKA